jgi:hypothetical protein
MRSGLTFTSRVFRAAKLTLKGHFLRPSTAHRTAGILRHSTLSRLLQPPEFPEWTHPLIFQLLRVRFVFCDCSLAADGIAGIAGTVPSADGPAARRRIPLSAAPLPYQPGPRDHLSVPPVRIFFGASRANVRPRSFFFFFCIEVLYAVLVCNMRLRFLRNDLSQLHFRIRHSALSPRPAALRGFLSLCQAPRPVARGILVGSCGLPHATSSGKNRLQQVS